jgi:hypothetical protein
MPLLIDVPQDFTSIDLPDYIDLLESQRYDLSSHDDLIDSARYLQQLNNNKGFLIDHMCQELRDINAFQKTNFYGPQVFILHSNDRYFLRAVVWNPVSKVERAIANFKYDICHDHNFDILTAGYCGPGYESRGYTYDNSQVKGMLGEKVHLEPQGTFTLSEGKIMLYRAKQDIHIQLPPARVSVSLNLIPRSHQINQPQFQFDETTHRICRYLHSSGSELVVRMAGVLGDPQALEPLDAIFRHNTNPHLQAFAAQSMIQIDPALQQAVEKTLYDTHNPLAMDIFQKEQEMAGASLRLYTD